MSPSTGSCLTCAAEREPASALARELTREGFLVVESSDIHPRGLIAIGAIYQSVAVGVAEAEKVEAMQRLSAAFGQASTQPTPATGTWARVVDVQTLAPIGVELWVQDDDDAFEQLDLLANALPPDTPREHITIHPPPGWNNYGDPRLVERYRR
jgi:hypothetical protein